MQAGALGHYGKNAHGYNHIDDNDAKLEDEGHPIGEKGDKRLF